MLPRGAWSNLGTDSIFKAKHLLGVGGVKRLKKPGTQIAKPGFIVCWGEILSEG